MHPYIAIPATLALVLRAWSNNSLTPLGLAVATATALVHALHPWPVFFALLVVFFLGGTSVTKIKHEAKSRLTHSSTGSAGGEGPRTHIQVLANSLVASILVLLHYLQLLARAKAEGMKPGDGQKAMEQMCWSWGGDLLVVGIVSNYAAAAADTFSSELGILSPSLPRLLTSPTLRRVPRGTNGGITLWGTLAGYLGAFTIAITTAVLLPFCKPPPQWRSGKLFGAARTGFEGGTVWGSEEIFYFVVAVTVWGGLGSLLDSFLGGVLQASVVDRRTGLVVEGVGGRMVPVRAPHSKKEDEASRKVEAGLGLLDNNAVNLLMATIMSLGGMFLVGWMWDVPIRSIWT